MRLKIGKAYVIRRVGQYPQVFEAAILIPHKEDGSAKIFFWPLLSLQMLKDMLEDIPP